MTESRVPPYDKEAEMACLGAILLNNKAMSVVQSIVVGADDFYVETNRVIYAAMTMLIQSGSAIDHVTLGNKLTQTSNLEKIGGPLILDKLTRSVATVANVDHYARIVRNHASVRRMIYAAQQIVADGFTGSMEPADYLAEARKAVTMASVAAGTGDGPVKIGDDLATIFKELESGKMPDNLVRTGIGPIDQLTGGLWPGLLTILGARPGMGKSLICLNIATNVALQGRPVLYIPTEDARRYAVLRELARFANVDMNDLMLRTIDHRDWPALVKGAEQIYKLPLWVDDSPGLSSDKIGQMAARHRQMHGLDLLIVDHIGELADKGDGATEIVENAAKGIRNIGKEFDIPVLLATQLNREVDRRKNKRPILVDLRQSGAIEQVARVVWFAYRRGYYINGCEDDPDMELIVAKATHGKTGPIHLWTRLSRMYVRGWRTDTDGVFPDDNTGKYVAPAHGYGTPKDTDGFFNNTGPQSKTDRTKHWQDKY